VSVVVVMVGVGVSLWVGQWSRSRAARRRIKDLASSEMRFKHGL